MRGPTLLIAPVLALAACTTAPPPSSRAERPAATPQQAAFAYPESKTVDVVDEYHGIKVADPYRWLEELDSAETAAWVEAQNRVTFSYLEQIPGREALRARLTELWDYERYGTPFRRGDRTFYSHNSGLQPQSIWYVTDGRDGAPRVLIDPNTLSEDGTVALSSLSISDDGRLAAYALSSAGSDWMEWRVRDVATGRDLDDHLRYSKFSGAAWLPDGSGFYYGAYDPPVEGTAMTGANFGQKLLFHRVGTPQSEDVLVYHRPDHKDWMFGPEVSEDGRYLVISVSVGGNRNNMLFYQDLTQPQRETVELLSALDASYSFVGNDGPVFYVQTDLDAPNRRLVAIDTRTPAKAAWRQVIGEDTDALSGIALVHDTFVGFYLHDAASRVRMFRIDGAPAGELPLPGLGSVGGFAGKRTDSETFYSYTSYTEPPTIYHYDFTTRESTVYRRPAVKVDTASLESRRVFYTSKDGTRVPLFITHKKGLVLDGSNPTLLYGYGGFRAAMRPAFSVARAAWMELGGVYAVAGIRGGSEYGEAWHAAGTREQKQNVFDDFIAAAEYLVRERITSPAKLAIEGGSNGGLLVGAVLNQRPDLFAAALPAVGVMDMLRFHKFTIGWAWVADYGSADDPAMFPALYAYSPLHNVRPGTRYPATLITTADHDDRVVPAHSFKYAAALQAAQAGPAPVLIRIETKAGHGAGKPTAKQIEETADKIAFLTRALGMPAPAGGSTRSAAAGT